MTSQAPHNSANTWVSPAALIAGLASIVLFALSFFWGDGITMLSLSSTLGVLGVILGIVGLRIYKPNGAAVAGIVTGAIGLLLGLGLIIFALLFIGAFSA